MRLLGGFSVQSGAADGNGHTHISARQLAGHDSKYGCVMLRLQDLMLLHLTAVRWAPMHEKSWVLLFEGHAKLRAVNQCWSLEWSSAGALLIAFFGFKRVILDGRTGRKILDGEESGLSFANATWASDMEVIFLPTALPQAQVAWIKFANNDGLWHHWTNTFQNAREEPSLDGLEEACISPNGRMVAGWSSNACARIHRHNLETRPGGITIPHSLTRAGFNHRFVSKFAGLPSAWPQVSSHIYTSLHHEEYGTEGCPSCLKVADQPHKLLGSWTSADLLILAHGRHTCTDSACDELFDCVRAPKGNHLAVFCNGRGWILVLTFREPA